MPDDLRVALILLALFVAACVMAAWILWLEIQSNQGDGL
jgi:hypothetical protein